MFDTDSTVRRLTADADRLNDPRFDKADEVDPTIVDINYMLSQLEVVRAMCERSPIILERLRNIRKRLEEVKARFE